MKYNFIDVEGFDGSGKSTIAKWISQEFGYEYHLKMAIKILNYSA